MAKSSERPLIATINATPLVFDPVASAFGEEFSRARLWHLLDDALLSEMQAAGGLNLRLQRRMMRLIDHALQEEADAVLLTCSGYSPVVDLVRSSSSKPIIKPDEAMFDRVIGETPRRVGLLATVEAAVEPAVAQLEEKARAREQQIEVLTACCTEAMEAARRGDAERLADDVSEAAEELVGRGAELLILAQYSMTSIRDVVAEATSFPVYSGPHAAAALLRELLNKDTFSGDNVEPRKEEQSNHA